MKLRLIPLVLIYTAVNSLTGQAQDTDKLSKALTFHASFDDGLNADFSRGERTCYVRQDGELVEASQNEKVTIDKGAGRFGDALHFTRKSNYWPLYQGNDVLKYNKENWDTSVSVWLRLNPDEDLEPGYCDPVQIVGGDVKQGFIFLEWSKDHTPRFFRFAVWPLYDIWNPKDVGWEEIPAEQRPLVQIANAPFSSDKWTHVVFTLENVNDKSAPSAGKLHINGEPAGTIDDWDLTLGWEPENVQLVLGAAYVGRMDDVAVFDRALTEEEVKQVYHLENGIRDLHSK